jgi:glycosyltransferase involved in cell wall biosynthesis
VLSNAISLAKNGCSVFLFVANRSKKDGHKLIQEQYGIEEIPANLFLYDVDPVLKSHFFFYAKVALLVRKNQAQIIITRTHGFLPFCFQMMRKDQKLYFETHDFFLDLSIRDDVDYSKRKKKSNLERKYFDKLDGIICLNSHQKELYRKYLPQQNISIFPTGLDQVSQSNVEKEDLIVYVGSLNKRLGIDKIAVLIQLLPQYDFVIAGGKSEEDIEYFQSFFADSNLPGNVEVTGWIDKKELYSILERAKIGLLPLADTFFNRYLTVPLKLFDYFSFGIASIAPDYPSVADFIRHEQTGFLIDWNDPTEVAKKIDAFFHEQKKQERMRDEISHVAAWMTWDRRAKALIKHFKRK